MKAFFAKHKSLILAILFTALCLFIWRIGVHIRLPFVEYTSGQSSDSIFGFLDIFTGGALQSFSIVALGISPYINSSIIVQLLQMDIVPQFKEWAEEGEAGKEKLNRWTRYIALFLAFVEGLALIVGYKVSYGYTYFQYVPNT
jgi:preprotein translocase subunit SecY